ncbi:MAG: HNH endonuclease [Treponema sp.]|nr:HNH endonuclease [Treponema sp.]
MTYSDINDFTQEETCIYKDEVYSVRDNGAVMRHAKENGRKRKIDGEWTFGNIDNKGFLRIGGEKVNRIVSSAFYGEPPTEQYVVFHKNYNSQDNRASNLNWVTKFEFKILQPNIQSQLRILTGKKIEEILSDISILQTIDAPNLNWMKGVTQTEANKCLEKYIDLKFSTPSEIEKLNWNSTENRQRVKTLNPNLHPSLTPNAVVNGNMIPSYFLCCPQEISENPLQAYFEKLQAGNVYYMNSKYKILILESALYEDKIIVKCESGDGENAIKPWSVSTITYENEMFVHSLYKTCFHRDSADKYFTVLQGKKWTGGDVFDDFC